MQKSIRRSIIKKTDEKTGDISRSFIRSYAVAVEDIMMKTEYTKEKHAEKLIIF